MGFSTAQQARFQALAESHMVDTCVLYARTDSSDGYDSAGSAVWTASGTVACRVQPANLQSDERPAAGQLLSVTEFDVHLPYGTNLGSVTRIGYGGGSVEVSGTVSPRSYQYDVQLRCTRISG